MSYFTMNLLLAVGWMLLVGHYSGWNFFAGYLVGFLTLWLTQPFREETRYFSRFRAAISLFFYFIWELLLSTARVVVDVLTVHNLSEPDILLVPLDAKTDMEVTILANLVSLTPGTLSLDVTPGNTHLVIHAMFAKDPDKIIRDVKEGMERRLLEAMRD